MIHLGDALTELRKMPAGSVHCVITSPPYWGLRDYDVKGQLGLEKTPQQLIRKLVQIFREVRRVLRNDGTLWVNMGDSYAGSWGAQGKRNNSAMTGRSVNFARLKAKAAKIAHNAGSIPERGVKPKDLFGIPWRLALALREDGWYLRQDIIWHKPNPMPESTRDRCTKAHEYIFMLAKSRRYYYNQAALREPSTGHKSKPLTWEQRKAAGEKIRRGKEAGKTGPYKPAPEGRNKRSVWTMATQPSTVEHFATFPIELPETCLLAGCPPGGVVMDPFAGAGTTWMAALKHGRQFVGIEISQKYVDYALQRVRAKMPLLEVAN